MVLLYIQQDREYIQVRRRGRFDITKDEASSPAHFKARIAEMQERMIWGLALHGYEYDASRGFEIRGPEEHVEYSKSSTPDPGPPSFPAEYVNDSEKMAEWERAEKARTARHAGSVHADEIVDYIIVGTFKKPTGKFFKSHQTKAIGIMTDNLA